MLEELLRAWDVPELKLVLLAPASSRIHRVAIERDFEWHDLPVKKDGLHMLDNLRAVKAACRTIPQCDRVHAWIIRVFPAAEWLGRKWEAPVSGTLHDNPFARKIHGPVLWDMRGMNLRSFRDWREMVWCTQELVLRTWWRWQWAHRAANWFEKLVCVSEAVHQECIRKGYKCPMTVIRNGLADISIPERVPSDKVRIGFLGMSRPASKGFSLVEQWICQLQEDVVWKLYGKASRRTLSRLENMNVSFCHEEHKKNDPNAYNLTPNTLFRGHQTCETIFSEIDILVHPSTTFDSLPTALIEAARARIPCVSSSIGGAEEIVEEGSSGFLFDSEISGEGLEKLKRLFDPQLRDQMGCSARQIFEEHFRVDRSVEEYRQVFI